MFPKASAIAEAYSVLNLEDGASIETVKSTYKQIALRTHPDKNPNNPDATAEFQRVGEAYNTLLRHLDRSSKPNRGGHPFGFSPFGGGDYDDEDDYDEYESDSDYEDLSFYMFLFENFMRGHARSYSHARYRREQPVAETPQEYADRIRRSREEQTAAQERRKEQAAARRLRAEQDRERERLEAEERQKAKVEEKKNQAAAQRKKAEKAIYDQQKKVQTTRSVVFAAARAGDAEKVRKGVWEDAVDAAGGEVKPGCDQFVKSPPSDPQETLLHIAARKGDHELVKWLDEHSADIEETNSQGLTPFHVGVQYGQIGIVTYFFEVYPPKDADYKLVYQSPATKSLLSLAVESHEPEVVWMILDNALADTQEINNCWAWVTSAEGIKAMSKPKPNKASADWEEKVDDIMKLLMTFGGFTPPATPNMKQHQPKGSANAKQTPPTPTTPTQTRSPLEDLSTSTTQPNSNPTPGPSQKQKGASRGRGRGRGKGKGKARS